MYILRINVYVTIWLHYLKPSFMAHGLEGTMFRILFRVCSKVVSRYESTHKRYFYKWHIGTCIFMIVFFLQDIYFLNNAYGYIFFLRCTCRLIGGKSRSIQQSKHLLIPNTLNNIAVRLLFSILESPILRNTTLCLTVKVMAHFFHLTTYKIHSTCCT